MKYNKIALIGMMGSGKSTISKILANKINFQSIELDEIFTQQENSSIADFFKNQGEEKFREVETEILKKALENENIVLSTGGGVVLKKENRNLLFQNNIFVIYLEATPETIFNRIKNDTTRPLLKVENPKQEIENLINKRQEFYKLANLTINTDNKTTDEITEEILKWIK